MDITKISKNEAEKLINKLSTEIQEYNNAYYQEDHPKISDAQYDQLFFTLKALEEKFPQYLKPDSPTLQIGSTVVKDFAKHTHKVPMLSLANGFSPEDIEDFITRTQRFLNTEHFPQIYCELKIDGLSFSATYEKGILTTASTRGDGYTGEDVTANIKTIKGFPTILAKAPEFLEVRGEIFIDKQDFTALNQQQEKNGKALFANPRNCAAGSLRQLDSSVTKSRPLKYFTYAIGYSSAEFANTQQELLFKLEELGFQTNSKMCRVAKSLAGLMEFYQEMMKERENIAYEIDGVVYKVNDFELQKRLGSIARTPRFAIAHKFPAILAETKLLSISLQVGRTGAITPVAELDPIKIGGVVVSRASLHNFDEIKRLDLKIGDTVVLHRAGDVIPKITEVNFSKRTGNETTFNIPKQCPACNALLHIDPEEVILRCDNALACPDQLLRSIIHFASKDALDIEGLGTKQIEFLQKIGMISNPVDIFYLEENNKQSLRKLENMPGWGTKSVENLFLNIKKAKTTTLNRFIYALGIRHIGDVNAKILAKEFGNAENFINSMLLIVEEDQQKYDQIRNLEGFADKTISDIKQFFSYEQNVITIKNLINILDIAEYKQNAKISSPISGLNVIFTGTLTSLSRSEAKSIAEKLGAKIVSGVSSSTDLVIAGEKAGSKLKKAEELGIKIISEEDWLKMVEDNNG